MMLMKVPRKPHKTTIIIIIIIYNKPINNGYININKHLNLKTLQYIFFNGFNDMRSKMTHVSDMFLGEFFVEA